MTREETKAAADASWGQDKEPRQTRMILVTLKNPVRLPVSLIDAIRLGGIEKIAALDEAISCTEIGHI